MPTLDEWCRQQRGRKAEVARRSGVSYVAIHSLVKGQLLEREDKALAVQSALKEMGFAVCLDQLWGPAARGEVLAKRTGAR